MMTEKEPIRVEYADGCLRVALLGEVDHHTARPLREKIDRQLYLYHPSEFVLSLGHVNFMDSSGLGLILGRLAVCRHFSCPMRLVGADARMMRILALAGMERMIGLEIEGLPRKERVHS